MFVSFEKAQQMVLTALYLHEYESNDQYSLTLGDIRSRIGDTLSSVYLTRVLNHLANEARIETGYDEDSSESNYWLATKGILAAEQFAQMVREPRDIILDIPAADRTVTLTDNQRAEIIEGLDEVSRELRSGSNEIGSELGDVADRIAAEMDSGRALVKSNSVRMDALITLLMKPLRFLMDKFAGAALGELAKRLVAELLKLVS